MRTVIPLLVVFAAPLPVFALDLQETGRYHLNHPASLDIG